MNEDLHGQISDQVGAYVLDALLPEEVTAFEEHLRTCDSCRSEVVELRSVVDVLPLALPPVEPSDALRDRIMSAVATDQSSRPALTALPGGAPKRSTRQRLFRLPETYLTVAAVAIIAALGLWNVHLQSRVNQQQAAVQLQQLVSKALNQHAAVYPVAPTVPAVTATAYLVQPHGRQAAYLIVKDLPKPASNKVYQLWLMRGSVPTSEGTFTYSGSSPEVVRMPSTAVGYNRTAVTVENGPHGSNHGPTSAPILLGNLGA